MSHVEISLSDVTCGLHAGAELQPAYRGRLLLLDQAFHTVLRQATPARSRSRRGRAVPLMAGCGAWCFAWYTVPCAECTGLRQEAFPRTAFRVSPGFSARYAAAQAASGAHGCRGGAPAGAIGWGSAPHGRALVWLGPAP